jgi:hypothetical protein
MILMHVNREHFSCPFYFATANIGIFFELSVMFERFSLDFLTFNVILHVFRVQISPCAPQISVPISLRDVTIVKRAWLAICSGAALLCGLYHTARQPALRAPATSVRGLSPIITQCAASVPTFCSA